MGGGGERRRRKEEIKRTPPPFIKLLKIAKYSGFYWS